MGATSGAFEYCDGGYLEKSKFFKKSKCSFATTSVTYLGHVVSASGVTMDTGKVHEVLDWPIPQSVRTL
jgi:hypothetical protein